MAETRFKEIDLDAIAIKQPRQTRQRKKQRKKRIAIARTGPYRRPSYSHSRCRPLRGVGLSGLVALAMTPGEWHTHGDIKRALVDVEHPSLIAMLSQMRRRWQMVERSRVEQSERSNYHRMVQYLYRLTPYGERWRRRAAVLV